MSKSVVVKFLFFAIIPSIKAQVSPVQGPPCPVDGKFEYDDFEKILIDLSKKSGIDILPKYNDLIDLCRTSPDPEACIKVKLKWIIPDHDPEEKTEEIENGITIINTYVPTAEPNKSNFLAYTENRHTDPDEDLHTCCGEDSDWIHYTILNSEPDGYLQNEMKRIFNLFTLGGVLGSVADDYLYTFNNKQGGSGVHHFNSVLSTYLSNDITMKNFIKNTGLRIQEELKKCNGDINSVVKPVNMNISIPRVMGPAWEDWRSNIDGMHILIGNTEQSFVYTLSYTYDQITKIWEGEFYFKVTDNFGIDKMDCVEKINGIIILY